MFSNQFTELWARSLSHSELFRWFRMNQGHKHDKRKNTRDPAMSVDNTDTAAHVVATLKSTFSFACYQKHSSDIS